MSQKQLSSTMNNFANTSFDAMSFNRTKSILISGLEDRQSGGMKGQGPYSMEAILLNNFRGKLLLHLGVLMFSSLQLFQGVKWKVQRAWPSELTNLE